jgi:ABC-type branched-subunit amino acid transport system ATPase component
MKTAILQAENLAKAFGGVQAIDLRGASLHFEQGKVSAVLGGNGAGKTTLFNVLNGVLLPDCGTVTLNQIDITYTPIWKRCRLGVSRLWQDIRLFPELNCIENIQVAIRGQRSENVWWALMRRRLVHKEEQMSRSQAIAILESVGLKDVMTHLASEVSYGQQKLLAIARTMCNPDITVALLDEPMAGLDKRMISKVTDLICFMRDKGMAVVVIEHDLHSIREIVDHAVFLDQGRCLAAGAVEDLLKCSDIRRRYIGLR